MTPDANKGWASAWIPYQTPRHQKSLLSIWRRGGVEEAPRRRRRNRRIKEMKTLKLEGGEKSQGNSLRRRKIHQETFPERQSRGIPRHNGAVCRGWRWWWVKVFTFFLFSLVAPAGNWIWKTITSPISIIIPCRYSSSSPPPPPFASFLQAVPRASLLRPKILSELFRQGGVKYRSPTNTECSCHSFYFSPTAAYGLCHHSTNNIFTGGAWRLGWRNYVENRKSAQRSHKELSPKDHIRDLAQV